MSKDIKEMLFHSRNNLKLLFQQKRLISKVLVSYLLLVMAISDNDISFIKTKNPFLGSFRFKNINVPPNIPIMLKNRNQGGKRL